MANQPKTLTLNMPDISNMPQTFISTDYVSGTALTVKDTNGFAANDYLVLGQLATEQCEIVQIASVTNSTAIVLVAGGNFPHAADSSVTKIPYNQFRVYRSATGIGGSYVLLVSPAMQVNQPDLKNKYYDPTATSPYSYKFSFYNTYSTVESTFSDEIPFTGYQDYSLKGMTDAVLVLFGDTLQQNITSDMIRRWLNECYRRLQVIVTGGDSPYYVGNTTITSTGAQSYDLTSYDMLNIFLVELSHDGGLTYVETIDPADARFKTIPGATSVYSYQIMGQTFIPNPVVNPGDVMRFWYFTNPVALANPTDTLLDPFQPLVDLFIDWALMRAHEKDRKMAEMASYYRSKVKETINDPNGVINRLKTRIKQGNKTMATPWMDDMSVTGGWM